MMIRIVYQKFYVFLRYIIKFYLRKSPSYHTANYHENYYYFNKVIIIFVMISRMVERTTMEVIFNSIFKK